MTRRGWIVLPVPGGRARRRVLLLHPDLGIALLQPAPLRGPKAAAALRRRLERVGFRARHGGLPPILHLALPDPEGAAEGAALHDLLCWEFAAHPPLALSRPTDWPETAAAAITNRAMAPRRPAPSLAPPPALPGAPPRPQPIRGPHRPKPFAPLPQRPARRLPRRIGVLAGTLVLLVALILAAVALLGREAAGRHHAVVGGNTVAPEGLGLGCCRHAGQEHALRRRSPDHSS